jgi:hypothetical protein
MVSTVIIENMFRFEPLVKSWPWTIKNPYTYAVPQKKGLTEAVNPL